MRPDQPRPARSRPAMPLVLAILAWLLMLFALTAADHPLLRVQSAGGNRGNLISVASMGLSLLSWAGSVYRSVKSWRANWALVVVALGLDVLYLASIAERLLVTY